ncbi:MAG: lambda exonuclease family protein [Burkholderiales bacterium]
MILQGSPEWLQSRVGMITASRIADVIAKTKTGESTSRANYRAQLVAERMTGQAQESFCNDAMRHGIEQEPYARIAYELDKGVMVDEVAMVKHPTIERAGASPDGCVGNDGLVEIKAPNTSTHIRYLLDDKPPAKYVPQMAWQLLCTGRVWCDFVSFDPRMPQPEQYFCVRYVPDRDYLAMLETEVERFDEEIELMIKKLMERRK